MPSSKSTSAVPPSKRAGASKANNEELKRRIAELEAENARLRAAASDGGESAVLSKANTELRDLTANLDKIVRQRTRALMASEEQLKRKNLELKQLNSMKAEFISIAAHELRTPMTSIIGYLDLMLEGRYGEVPDEALNRIKSVRRNAQRLMRLVEQMLDVSRIESGKVQLNRQSCDLAEIARDVIDELNPLASKKGHSLEAVFEASERVDGDADKLHQVVSNLVANAIRYTPHDGKIIVRVDNAPKKTYAGSWVRLRVLDNGIGIPEGHYQRIFEPFADVHSAKHHTSSEPDSAGLGLYVVQGLVGLHGGLITVKSQEGEFAEFTVLLPSEA